MSKRLLMSGTAVLFAVTVTAAPAAAGDLPEPRPGTPTVTEPGPPNYPNYDPQFEPATVTAQDTGVDASSAALGALAGVALAGAGLGTAFLVARHRDRSTAPQSA